MKRGAKRRAKRRRQRWAARRDPVDPEWRRLRAWLRSPVSYKVAEMLRGCSIQTKPSETHFMDRERLYRGRWRGVRVEHREPIR